MTEGDPLLEEIIITTNTCKGCQGTAVEDGVMLHIVGGEGIDGQVTCNSDPLDNKAVVDAANLMRIGRHSTSARQSEGYFDCRLLYTSTKFLDN